MRFLSDLVTRMRRPEQVKTSNAGPMIAWSQVGQPKWTPRRYDNLAEEGFRKNVVAYRCVMQIATACSAVPWLLYDDADMEIDRHPMLDLLRHPNPLQDGVTFMESVYADLEIAGNAYIEAVKPRDDQAPVELYVLRPDRMKVIPGPTGLPQGYQYSVNGQVTTWSCDPLSGASNILHLKRFHPLDDWYGMAPMEAALLSIDQHNAAGAWNQALLGQGARPSGALVYAPKDGPATLSDDQIRRLREEMGTLYQGDRNAGRPMILEGGLDWKEMSLSPKDMDWLAGRNNAARDIAVAFGVPAQLIGIPDTQTYANMAEARMAFYEETVLPNLTRVTASLDHWLCPMYRDNVWLDFDEDCISALTEKKQTQWNRIQNSNFLTRNEMRELAGYGPVQGGDDDGDSDDEPSGVFGKFNPDQPRVPAGSADGGQWTSGDGGDSSTDDPTSTIDSLISGTGDILQNIFGSTPAEAAEPDSTSNSTPDSWGNSNTLLNHFHDHASDFNATSPEDYANQANQFYQRFQDEGLPAVQDSYGVTRVYDPASNTFGSYNPDGSTRTFFKPKNGADYFDLQIENDLSRGGRIINPLSESGGGGGLNRTGKPGDAVFNPLDIIE